jgi:hypothetical protein
MLTRMILKITGLLTSKLARFLTDSYFFTINLGIVAKKRSLYSVHPGAVLCRQGR